MSDRHFRKLLTSRQEEVNSLVCVGLDPLLEKMPEAIKTAGRKGRDPTIETVIQKDPRLKLAAETMDNATFLFTWMKEVVDATAPYACMYKPQRAHWESVQGGIEAMRDIIAYIHNRYPEIPVFLDCKRGDIDRTQAQYRVAHFELDGADGMNYNGYMGKDTLKSLIDPKYIGRALVGLGRTSNPDAWEFQDRELITGNKVWQWMVRLIHSWSNELHVLENAGVVMGAAHKDPNDPRMICSDHLSLARKTVGNDLWFLIPGIGTQGGFVEQTVGACYVGPGSIAINSSSGIIFDPDPAKKAMELRDQINDAIAVAA